MTNLERWSLHLAALLTGATGLLYGWLRYYGQRAGEFGLEAHPFQATMQHLHVLAAPLLVFTLGMLVRGHVLPMYRSGRITGRATGLMLVMGLALMVLAGYGVQVVMHPEARVVLAWLHGVSSVVFLSIYCVHMAMTWAASQVPESLPDVFPGEP